MLMNPSPARADTHCKSSDTLRDQALEAKFLMFFTPCFSVSYGVCALV